jgi:leader peptidase (prepilin peptidase)/N-methyltransferase
MSTLGIALCGVVGLAMGSFLTVVTSRVPAGLSIVKPGSRCPSCATPLRGVDNVPVVSYLLRRGHCKTCDVRIPARYLALEVGTGLAFAILALRLSPLVVLLPYLVLTVGLVAAAVIDLSCHRIPAAVVYSTAAVGAPLLVIASAWEHRFGALLTALAAAGIAFALFFVIVLLVPHGMGFGDVRFVPLCAGFLGWLSWRIAFAGVVGGIVLAGIFGVALLLGHGANRKSKIPLGPFLAAGSFIALLAGNGIAAIWLR